ncbi:MAG: 3-oxoacid CoA-transferase [Deltaproteobacteria bacterium]|nr:3-oxoacid CoA-transferase [Deltaproteobacteria bacterium]
MKFSGLFQNAKLIPVFIFLTSLFVSFTFLIMDNEFQKILRDIIPLQAVEGQSKVMPLAEAVLRYVRPGMTLHLGVASTPAFAFVYELCRLFRGRAPRFSLVTLGLTTIFSLLVHAGLIRKAVTTYLGDSYPSPGPNAVFQAAFREGNLEVEHWSLLSLVQRLKAGAMGIPFLPGRSIMGSTMEQDNRGSFQILNNPFAAGERVGLMSRLTPDLSLYHGIAADPQGNTLFAPPYAENLYGALASQSGVLVTVEKIVSTEFLREYSGFVRLPGYRVLSVSEVPLGGHPGGCNVHGIRGIEGYAVDNPFILDLRAACRKKETLDAWMDEWVFSCSDFPAYRRKLGGQRIEELKDRSKPDSWKEDLPSILPVLQAQPPANAMERMVIAASREIISRVKRNDYRTLLAGIGASNLSAWLATYHLRREGYPIDVMAEIGFYGYLPRPGDPFIFNLTNIPTCKMLTDISEILGILMGGANQRCLGALSAAQVDRCGNLNSTMIPPNILITGSGGANDVASGASEVLVVVPQSRLRLVPEVPYITAPGKRVRTLVTTQGFFEKPEGENEFWLTGILEDGKTPAGTVVTNIKAETGWVPKMAAVLKKIPQPDSEELALLRLFDPQKIFVGDPV